MPMDTEQFRTDIAVGIVPTAHDVPPAMTISLDHAVLWDGELHSGRNFLFSPCLVEGLHSLEIELHSKPDADPVQALTITNFSLGQIQSSRFVWQAVYHPRYPEPWASQQQALGVMLCSELRNTNHLGWNGVWRLEFTAPIFTWIHRVENLGWIYD